MVCCGIIILTARPGMLGRFNNCQQLQLYDKNGNPGWLTASYANDRNKPTEILFEKSGVRNLVSVYE